MPRRRSLALFFNLLLSFPCYALAGNDPAPPGLIPITLPGGTIIHAELADTPQKRAEGLMYREHLGADRGMLFTFSQAQAWVFWMKNTKIPLDILYFDDALKLVSQQRDVPPCSLGDRCPPYPSDAPARYVLELNAGEAARIGLKDGAELKFGPGIKAGN